MERAIHKNFSKGYEGNTSEVVCTDYKVTGYPWDSTFRWRKVTCKRCLKRRNRRNT